MAMKYGIDGYVKAGDEGTSFSDGGFGKEFR